MAAFLIDYSSEQSLSLSPPQSLSGCSLFLTVSPSPSSHLCYVLLPPRAVCLRFSSRARFFPSPRILIFFINFSQALQTILRLPLSLLSSPSHLFESLGLVALLLIPRSPTPGLALLRVHPRRPLSFSRTTDVSGPFAAGVAGARPCPSARTSLVRSLAEASGFRVSRFAPSRLFFPPRIFRR